MESKTLTSPAPSHLPGTAFAISAIDNARDGACDGGGNRSPFTAGPHNFTFTPSSSNPVLRLKTRPFQSEIARFRFCSKLHMVPPGEATANPYQYRHAGTQDENFGKSEAAFRFYFFASQAPQLVRPGVSGLQRCPFVVRSTFHSLPRRAPAFSGISGPFQAAGHPKGLSGDVRSNK